MGGDGLAGSVLDGTLRCHVGGDDRPRPFEATKLDVELLNTVDAAADRGIPLGLVFPLAGTSAPMLVGAASLVGAIRRSRRLDVQVGLAAKNLAPRVLYDKLYIENQRLADFVPRTAIGIEGDVRTIGAPPRDSLGRLHITSSLDRLIVVDPALEAIVIDASASVPQSLENALRRYRTSSMVYMTTDPFDPSLTTIRSHGGLVHAWSADRVSALSDGCSTPTGRARSGALIVDRSFLGASAACDVEIEIASGSPDLDSALEKVWTLLRDLGRVIPNTTHLDGRPAEELWWAWGVLNTISLLPAEPERYDQFVGPYPTAIKLMEAPSIASAFAQNARGEIARHWHDLSTAFQRLLVEAATGSRTQRVAEWVTELVSDNVYGTLVVKNRAASWATRQALDESPDTPHGWSQHVWILTLSELAKGEALTREPSSVCVPGPIPRSRSGVFALPPATELRVIAAGDFEGRRIAAQVTAARAEMAELARRGVCECAARLGLRGLASNPARVGGIRFRGQSESRDANHGWNSRVDPWEPFDSAIAATLRRQVAAGTLPKEEASGTSIRGGGEPTAAVITIELDNGPEGRCYLLVEPNDLVARRQDDEVERIAAKALRLDDIVLLIDHGARGDLLATLVERLAETPYYSGLQHWIDFWHTRAARGRQSISGLTQQQILSRMTGTTLTSAGTIGTWIRGTVDGPRDPEDVARFARAIEDDQLLTQAKQIAWALATIHKTHKRIGSWITRRLTGIESHREQLILDDDNARVYVTDLMDAISVHRVRGVHHSLARVPVSAVGALVATPPHSGTASSE